jgi:hypothetical protein
MSIRIRQSPGVEIRERPASLNITGFGDTTVLVIGFASKGEVYNPVYCTSVEDFIVYFGSPETEPEVYLFQTVRDVILEQGVALVMRLPYDNTMEDNYKYYELITTYDLEVGEETQFRDSEWAESRGGCRFTEVEWKPFTNPFNSPATVICESSGYVDDTVLAIHESDLATLGTEPLTLDENHDYYGYNYDTYNSAKGVRIETSVCITSLGDPYFPTVPAHKTPFRRIEYVDIGGGELAGYFTGENLVAEANETIYVNGWNTQGPNVIDEPVVTFQALCGETASQTWVQNVEQETYDSIVTGEASVGSVSYQLVNERKAKKTGAKNDEGLFCLVVTLEDGLAVQRNLTEDYVFDIVKPGELSESKFTRPLSGTFRDKSVSYDFATMYPSLDGYYPATTGIIQVAWEPTEITTHAWYDASDSSTIAEYDIIGYVTQWNDKSGNNYNLSQSNASIQPQTRASTLNGKNVLTFSSDSLIDLGFPIPDSGDISVFIVMEPTFFNNNSASLFHFNAISNDVQFDTNSGVEFIGRINASGIGSDKVLTGGPFTGPTIFNVTFDYSNTGTYNAYVDGTKRTTDTTYVNKLTNPMERFALGVNRGLNRYLDGDYAEVILVEDCTDETRQKIEGYLAHKWGLASNLPSDHPYKTAAPTVPGVGYFEGNYDNIVTLVVAETKRDPNDRGRLNVNILEAHTGSVLSDAEVPWGLDKGQDYYIGTVINRDSNYVKFYQSDLNAPALTLEQFTTELIPPSIQLLSFNPNEYNKLINTTQIPNYLEQALRKVESMEDHQIDIVADAGLSTIAMATSGTFNTQGLDITDTTRWQAVCERYANFCSKVRKDCMAVLDVPRPLVLGGEWSLIRKTLPQNTVANTIVENMKYLRLNNSYVALYNNWLRIFDEFSNKNIWVPPTCRVAGVYVRSDKTGDAGDPPAGPNVGQLINVSDLSFHPKHKETDLIYRKKCNYVNLENTGIILQGQKTRGGYGAFSRVQPRRIMCRLFRLINEVLKYYKYEPNNDITRKDITSTVEPIFELLKAENALYDFKFVCDETNNTSDVIDRNELVVQVGLKFTKRIEFILVDFIAVRVNTDFRDVL